MQMTSCQPQVDLERCTLCGLCVEACPCYMIEWTDRGPLFHCAQPCESEGECVAGDDCWLSCESACPEGAIACPFEIALGDSSVD